jgi:hypothetical protein
MIVTSKLKLPKSMNGVFVPNGYIGYITLRGLEVPIQLELKDEGIQIFSSENLKTSLTKSELANIKKALDGSKDIHKIVTDLKELLVIMIYPFGLIAKGTTPN